MKINFLILLVSFKSDIITISIITIYKLHLSTTENKILRTFVDDTNIQLTKSTDHIIANI